MNTITLNNGVAMPIIGFGVYQIEPNQTEKVVGEALQTGYRSIDTAAAYENEQGVGRAIAQSGIARDELFVATKLWVEDCGYESTKRAIERSLEKLRLDYLDLYLIHQPFGDVYGSWRAMEELHRQGLIRAIGVSNFHPDRLQDLILHNEITPAVNQVEMHPFCQQTKAHEFMEANGIQMQSWAPFAEGRNALFDNEILKSIGRKHDKSVAQVILRWMIQGNVVAIPKSVHQTRMAENIEVFDFELTAAEIDTIKTMDTGASLFLDHRDPATVKWIGTIKHNS